MERRTTGIICVLCFLSGAIASNTLGNAQAHNSVLTRFDIERALRDVMRSEPKTAVSRTDMEAAIRQALQKCRFKGQYTDETAQEDDATDFVGQIAC